MSLDILLIGAQGQLGWEIERRAQAPLKIRALDRAQLDITDRDSVLRSIESTAPRVVVNAAAYTAVDKAETDVAATFAVNREGPGHISYACAHTGAPLIHISTDYVFDGAKESPYEEDDPPLPLGVYGASKLAGEQAVRESGCRHVILRSAWVYGVHGRNFVKTMLRLAEERDVVQVVDDQRGCPTFAGDLADAVIAVARQLAGKGGTEAMHGTFHCVNAGETTWFGFARRIFEIAGPELRKVPEVEPITTAEYPTPARRPRSSVLDCSKLARHYGISLRPWEDALAEMLRETLNGDAANGEMRREIRGS